MSSDDPLWVGAEEVPRSGLPDADKILKRAFLYRIVVWTSVIMFPLLLLVVATRVASPATVVSAAGSQGAPQRRVIATQEVEAWLASNRSPFGETAFNVAWVSELTVTTEAFPPVNNLPSQHPGVLVTNQTFSVATGAGPMWVSVQVVSDTRGAAKVLGSPSAVPQPQPVQDGWDAVGTWPGYHDTAAVPSTVKRVIGTWSDAYLSGDAEMLRLAVGDPDSAHGYVPLPAASGINVSAVRSAFLAPGSDQMMVRIVLGWFWPGLSSDTSGQVVYDLLIDSASTAAPKVVAWGYPGAGPFLVRFGNAVLGNRGLVSKVDGGSGTPQPMTAP